MPCLGKTYRTVTQFFPMSRTRDSRKQQEEGFQSRKSQISCLLRDCWGCQFYQLGKTPKELIINCFTKQQNWRSSITMQQEQNNEKIFYALMQRIGADHRYQKILLIIWIFVAFTIGSTVFSAPFLLLESHYTCPNLTSHQCEQFVCSLPQELRPAYLKEQVSSIATYHGDYHCDKKQDIVKAEAFVYIGGIAGVLSGAFLTSCLTKRTLFILAVFMSLVGVTISLFSVNLEMGSIGMFLNYGSKSIQVEMIYCYINETVDQSKRGKHQTVIFMFEALGSALNGPIIYLLASWKMFLIFMYVIPNLIILLFLTFFVHQTVYDSLVYRSAEESQAMLDKIAKINGTEDTHLISLEEIKLIQQNFSSKVTGDADNDGPQSASIIDLFYYKSIRSKILLVIFLGLFVQFNFEGPELMIGELAMPVYINGFFLGISEVFSCIVGFLMVDEFERRKMMMISTLIGIGLCLPVAILSNCSNNCTHFQQIFQTVGLFLFRMAMSFTFTTYILTQFELFPTQVRGMAVQIVSSSGYIAVAMVPVVSKLLLKALNISVSQCFIFNCVVILILAYFVPETYNNPAPDMIEQLYQEGQQIDSDSTRGKITPLQLNDQHIKLTISQ